MSIEWVFLIIENLYDCYSDMLIMSGCILLSILLVYSWKTEAYISFTKNLK